MIITYDVGSKRFNYRIAAVIVHDGKVLLHTADKWGFWALPGGRAEMREPSPETLTREMREELGINVTVGRLIWVVENFFRFDTKDYHELALYYEVALPANSSLLKQAEFHGNEGAQRLTFRWLPVAETEHLIIYPRFLMRALRAIPATTTHLIEIDPIDA